ncbi:MAG: hypothetical protein F6J93_04805 [Oscillatoria sp. SIO1A7]|nr:hypothetical protein [Oscillatoria sp. SIO1A7]
MVSLGAVALLMGAIAPTLDKLSWIPFLTLAGLLLIGILFGTLTVEIDESKISCWFGFGLIRKEFLLAEVTDAVAVKNLWFYGWGIRYIPRGWMFNVSGLDAVEITSTSGKHFRIGTDEPRKLESAIRQGAGLPS